MELNISGRNTNVSDSLSQYAFDKFSKLEKFFVGATRLEAVMRVEHDKQITELIASVQGHKDFVAEASEDDMYAAVDVVADKMGRQLRKHKERVQSHRGSRKVEHEAEQGQQPEE